jgi:hypothetical protein
LTKAYLEVSSKHKEFAGGKIMDKLIEKVMRWRKLILYLYLSCSFLSGMSSLFGEAPKHSGLTEQDRAKLQEMIQEHYEKDSLRHYCHTQEWRERLRIREKSELQVFDYHLYYGAGAVYGRVEKVEGHPEDSVYHTWGYIKPYRVFKDIVTDSNGYVVVKEWPGPGPMGGTIAGMKPLREGTDVLMFLQDIPWTGLGMKAMKPSSPTIWKKAIEKNALPLTSDDGYYEFGPAFIIPRDEKLQHMPRGYGMPWPRVGIKTVVKELEKAETIWKNFTKKQGDEK